jgi:uncharacterized membrane protein
MMAGLEQVLWGQGSHSGVVVPSSTLWNLLEHWLMVCGSCIMFAGGTLGLTVVYGFWMEHQVTLETPNTTPAGLRVSG